MKAGLLEQSPEPLPPLASFQRYQVYPSRFLKDAHWSITGKCNFQCRHCLVSALDYSCHDIFLHNHKHKQGDKEPCRHDYLCMTGANQSFYHDFTPPEGN